MKHKLLLVREILLLGKLEYMGIRTASFEPLIFFKGEKKACILHTHDIYIYIIIFIPYITLYIYTYLST